MQSSVVLLSFILSIFLAFCQCNSDHQPVGLKIRLTDKGIKHALFMAEQALNYKLQTTKLPGVRVEIDGGPGKGMLQVRKLAVDKFRPPTYDYTPRPPSGLQWTFKDGLISVKGAWSAWYDFVVKMSLDGYFIASVEDMSLNLVLDITKGQDGRLELKVPNCKAEIGNVRVKITSKSIMGKLFKWFSGAIEDAIEKALQSQICKQAERIMVDVANSKIRALPTNIKIYGPIGLDYTLSAAPLVSPDFVEGDINGSITYNGQHSVIDVPIMPDIKESDKMMYIWATDYIPQSLFTTAHLNNMLKFELSRAKTPQYENFLRTTCTEGCIGVYKEQIAEKYPNTSVIIELWTPVAPTVTFDPVKSELSGYVLANIYAEPKSVENLILFLQVDLRAKFLPYMVGNDKVAGNVSIEHLDLHVNHTNIGEISGFEIYIVLEIAQPILQEKINKILTKGYTIPTYKGVHLKNPKITMLAHAMQIDTDVDYTTNGVESESSTKI